MTKSPLLASLLLPFQGGGIPLKKLEQHLLIALSMSDSSVFKDIIVHPVDTKPKEGIINMWKLTFSSMAVGLFIAGMGAARISAAEVPAGQKIFTELKCNKCHTVDSVGIAVLKSDEKDEEAEEEGDKKKEPSDLSAAGKEHDVAFITKWLQKEEKIEGKKHKKKFKGTDEELKTVSEWLGTLKYNVPKKKE